MEPSWHADVTNRGDDRRSLIGRDRELTVLRDVLAAIHERGEAVVVLGAPGLGKTSLLDAVAGEATASGLRVLHAAGVEAEQSFPYAALRQLLQPLLRSAIDLPPRSVQMLRNADDHGSPGGPPDLFAVAMAALTVLTVAADALPVVLLVDDLQWFDGPSTDVLGFVMRRIHDDAIVAFVAGRPEAPRYGDAHELVLSPLVPADATALLEPRRRHAAHGEPAGDPAPRRGQPAGHRRARPRQRHRLPRLAAHR